MTEQRRIGQRLKRLPAALARRVLHQWALFRGRQNSLARTAALNPRRLLVMCYGNIYRSPFVAASIGRRIRGQPGFEIRSAGFHPVQARPSPPDYVHLVAATCQIDLESHRSRVVAPADLEWADAIIIMDRYNWERLRPFGADIQGKIIWLGAFSESGPLEIQDPYSLPLPKVRAIVDQMQAAAEGLAARLLQTGR